MVVELSVEAFLAAAVGAADADAVLRAMPALKPLDPSMLATAAATLRRVRRRQAAAVAWTFSSLTSEILMKPSIASNAWSAMRIGSECWESILQLGSSAGLSGDWIWTVAPPPGGL